MVSLKHLYIPIIVSIGIFLVALAWNDAITSTITLIASLDRSKITSLAINAGVKWIFVVIVTIVLAIGIYLGRNYLPIAFREESITK